MQTLLSHIRSTRNLKHFNFHVINVEDNDIDQIEAAFKEARKTKGMPTAIIAKTIKGKGVSFMEDQADGMEKLLMMSSMHRQWKN